MKVSYFFMVFIFLFLIISSFVSAQTGKFTITAEAVANESIINNELNEEDGFIETFFKNILKKILEWLR